MKPTSRAALLAASLAGLAGLSGGIAGGGMSSPDIAQQVKPGITANQGTQTRSVANPANKLLGLDEFSAISKALFGGYGRRGNRHRWPGLGWSVRQGQRMAKKRRNQQRNRKAHR